MTFDISTAAQLASSLNEKLEPIANRLVDVNDPNWATKFRNPLDEAGIRREAQDLLCSILNAYEFGDAFLRSSIRRLLSQNPAFAWATGVPEPATTAHGFRQRLIHMSALDQTQEIRDAVLMLNELCSNAKRAGVDVGPILVEVAALSSDITVQHFGSLKSIFLHARTRWG